MVWVGMRSGMGAIYYAGLARRARAGVYHLWLIRGRDRDGCFRAFLANHWLGLAVFAGIALDFALRSQRWPHGW